MLALERRGLMPKIEILPLKLCDIESVAEIEKECFSVPWSVANFEESLKDPMNYFICAKLSDKVLGYAGMYGIADEGYVYNIAVSENFRGRGIAKLMIQNLIKHSKDTKLRFLSLEVRKSNEIAIFLYEKYGFKKCGLRRNFYQIPNEDAFVMTHIFE